MGIDMKTYDLQKQEAEKDFRDLYTPICWIREHTWRNKRPESINPTDTVTNCLLGSLSQVLAKTVALMLWEYTTVSSITQTYLQSNVKQCKHFGAPGVCAGEERVVYTDQEMPRGAVQR